VKEME